MFRPWKSNGMQKLEQLKHFYKRKLGWVPDNLNHQLGHFNVFPLDPFVGENAEPVPYVRRDFYKIMLVKGKGTVHYASKTVEVKQQALCFSNPKVPYKWESTKEIESGYFCIFNEAFFHQFGNINQYSIFHPQGNFIFELSDEQVKEVEPIYEKMFAEINSNYAYKYDLLRNLAFELIHIALKMQPAEQLSAPKASAAERITQLFFELLDRQFPVDQQHPVVNFRTASEFAQQLNIHVNHLNKALKETCQKTTSQLISDRLLQEAKILLKETQWNISEVAYALGFKEVSHFNNFFKQHTQLSPSKFRKL